jgi:hypothetical protein
MRCEECLMLLEQYFDGELDEQTAGLVTEHKAACVSCASAYRKLRRELELYLRYECGAEATSSFWAEVGVRLRAENMARSSRSLPELRRRLARTFGAFTTLRFSPSATAVMVLFAIALTVGVMRYADSPQGTSDQVVITQNGDRRLVSPSPEASEVIRPGVTGGNQMRNDVVSEPVANTPHDARGRRGKIELTAVGENLKRSRQKPEVLRREITPDELVREAEQKYVAAIALLSRDFSRRRSQLDHETVAQFERTLAAVDRTIAGTRRAVREHPDDPVAVQYMLAAYAKKVEVLREMNSY